MIKETFSSILKGKLTFSPEIDKHGKSLISKLLISKPSERIGIKNGEGWSAVKNHPFFSDINWSRLKDLSLPVPFKPQFKNNEDVSNFDEMFTNEEVILTPYPSFVYCKGGNSVAEASLILQISNKKNKERKRIYMRVSCIDFKYLLQLQL